MIDWKVHTVWVCFLCLFNPSIWCFLPHRSQMWTFPFYIILDVEILELLAFIYYGVTFILMLMQKSLFLEEWQCHNWYRPSKELLDRMREYLWTELDKGMNGRLKIWLVVNSYHPLILCTAHMVLKIVFWTSLWWNLYTKVVV
jgi:hypothetical protein